MCRKLRITVISALFLLASSRILLAQNSQEIVITIEGSSAADKLGHFDAGETLRKQMRFADAIREYEKVIAPGESCEKESEAHYNIGLCYTWLGKLDSAETTFENVTQTYPNDGMAIGFSQLGLAWVEVRKENVETEAYRQNCEKAIARLQQTLDSKICPDPELNALLQFQIGRIYGSYLGDWIKAREVFRLVLDRYPNTKVVNHPFINGLRSERP